MPPMWHTEQCCTQHVPNHLSFAAYESLFFILSWRTPPRQQGLPLSPGKGSVSGLFAAANQAVASPGLALIQHKAVGLLAQVTCPTLFLAGCGFL